MRRLLAAVGSAALLAAGVVLPITPAAADPVNDCSASRGVLVVVDLRPFGGSVTRGCDASPNNGYEALQQAGFSTEGTQKDGPAFICRINGRPTSRQDPCVRTPPASAYWSYWIANAGQKSWSYSTRGAMTAERGRGSIDAWVFGATDVGGTSGGPCFSPADARAGRATSCASKAQPTPSRTRTKSPTSKRPSPSATSDRPAGGAAPTTSASSRATATTSPPATSRPAAAATSTATSTATSAPPSSSVPAIVDATNASGDRNDSSGGSAAPVFLGLGLAVVLAAGAGLTMLRRRRTDPEL